MTSIAEAFFSSSAATQRFTNPIPAEGFSLTAGAFFFAGDFFAAQVFFSGVPAAFFTVRLAVVPTRLAVVFVVFDLAAARFVVLVFFVAVVFFVVGMAAVKMMILNDS